MKRTPLQRKKPLRTKTPPSSRKPIQKGCRKRKRASQKDTRWRSEAYLSFVRSLHCSRCGGPGGDAHHLIGLGYGLSGMGLTAPDSYALPVCRTCHRAIHESPELQRWQPDWLRDTISRGVRAFDGEVKAELMRAWQFIDEREAA